jgi:hypothetical protein
MAGLIQTTQTSGANTINPITGLADGELKLDPTGAYYTPKGGMTVEDRVTGLLAKDNPYTQVARTGAAQTANSRGLLNSSIAAGAGEEAAIKSVLPIAQQDAAYYQNLGQQKNQGAVTSILNKEQGDTQSKLQKEQGDIQKGLYETQGNVSSKLSAQTAAQDQALKQMDIEWNKIQLAAQTTVEAARLSGANKEMFNNSVNKISDDFMNDYLEIAINPNFKTPEDRQKALDVLGENAQANYKISADIAGYELSWTPPANSAAATETAANPATATEKYRSFDDIYRYGIYDVPGLPPVDPAYLSAAGGEHTP